MNNKKWMPQFKVLFLIFYLKNRLAPYLLFASVVLDI